MLFKVRTRGVLEMLNMKEPPGMCVKTKESVTNRPSKNMLFSRKCTNQDPFDASRSRLLPENAAIVQVPTRSGFDGACHGTLPVKEKWPGRLWHRGARFQEHPLPHDVSEIKGVNGE